MPRERVLVVRTDQLSAPTTVARLKAFLGIKHVKRTHLYKTPQVVKNVEFPFETLPPGYVDGVLADVLRCDPQCADIVKTVFPERWTTSWVAWRAHMVANKLTL